MLTYCNIDDNINPALNKCRKLNNYVLIVIRRGIEVVITRRSWKPFVRKGAWVRIPPPALSFALKQRYKRKWKKFLTNAKHFDRINKLSQESKTKNIDNWTVRNLERFWESIRTLQWKLKTFKTVNSEFVRKRWKQSACRIVWGATDSCKFICNLNERISQV